MKFLALVLVMLLLVGCGGGAVKAQYRPQEKIEQWSNADWQAVLDVVATSDGYVRWDKLKNNEGGAKDALQRYVGQIGAASFENRPELFPTDADRQAYMINAYNALCMYGVMKRGYPGNMLASVPPGALFFTDQFKMGGKNVTLDTLEQKKLLDTYGRDPRFHFALNCMSTSCPPLRSEPFEGAKLDAQLADQAKIFLSDERAVRSKGERRVGLNDIFTDFYKKDFTRKGEVDLLDALRKLAGPDSPVQSATDYSSIGYNWNRNNPPS